MSISDDELAVPEPDWWDAISPSMENLSVLLKFVDPNRPVSSRDSVIAAVHQATRVFANGTRDLPGDLRTS